MMGGVETGALQINNDWTGLLVRGDDTFSLREIIERAQEWGTMTPHAKVLCDQLLDAIMIDVDHNSRKRNVQRIRTEGYCFCSQNPYTGEHTVECKDILIAIAKARGE